MKLKNAIYIVCFVALNCCDQAWSAKAWDPCENVYRLYSDCFTADRNSLNEACAFGTNDKFVNGMKKASLTCRNIYEELTKKNGKVIKVRGPCADVDTRLRKCFSSDKDSIKKACVKKKVQIRLEKLTMVYPLPVDRL